MRPARSRWQRQAALACAIGCILAWASPAWGEHGAMARIRQGEQDFAEGRFDRALEAFLEANRLSPQPALLYNIAMCQWELGRIPDAVNSFRDYMVRQEDLSGRDLEEIRRVLEELRPRHGDITLVTSDAGAELLIDGRDVGTAPLRHPVALEPGEHAFTAQMAGSGSRIVVREVAAGQALTLDLTLVATEPVAGTAGAVDAGDPDGAGASDRPGRTREPGAPRLGWGFWTVLAVMGMGGLATAVTGGVALYADGEGFGDTADALTQASFVLLAVTAIAFCVDVGLLIAHAVARRRSREQAAPAPRPAR